MSKAKQLMESINNTPILLEAEFDIEAVLSSDTGKFMSKHFSGVKLMNSALRGNMGNNYWFIATLDHKERNKWEITFEFGDNLIWQSDSIEFTEQQLDTLLSTFKKVMVELNSLEKFKY